MAVTNGVLVIDKCNVKCPRGYELEVEVQVPGLSRIPVIGALFGRQTASSGRSEVIVLLTPTIVRNPQEARSLTDEYSRRFRAMEPLNKVPSSR